MWNACATSNLVEVALVGVERVVGFLVGPVVVHFGTALDWRDFANYPDQQLC